jgi:hypothetical protein
MNPKEHPNQYQGIGPLFDSVKPSFVRSDFDGVTYEPKFDATRLRGEMARVYKLMSDNYWRTLHEISDLTGDPEASISARLRDLRKSRFGSHTVNRRRRGDPKQGIFEYQLL